MIKRRIKIVFVAAVFVLSFIAVSSAEMTLSSRSFEHQGDIPARFTCQGDDINPELTIADVPKEAKTLVLIVDDPDAPVGTWVHWVVINIPLTQVIREGSVPGDQAYNDFKRIAYGGPCPPSGKHRYFFKLYALDTAIPLAAQMKKRDVELAMKGHVIAETVLIGLYEKK